MKIKQSKKDIREQIEQQVSEYLGKGGEVMQIEKGTSAMDLDGSGERPTSSFFQQPKAGRTPVTDVVANLEARRRPTKKSPARKNQPQPQRVPVYDDFGEVIRWVWRESLPNEND